MLGAQIYPFPETTDFSAFLVKAQASGAKILGICGAGADLINIVKQAHEFGLTRTMNLAAMVAYTTDIRSIGIEMAAGTRLSETYYWDLNERTREFPEAHPAQGHAVAEHGAGGRLLLHAALPEDGRRHGCGGGEGGRRGDGRAHEGDADRRRLLRSRQDPRGWPQDHPAYLFEVKQPSESKGEWDLYKLIGTTPADEAFRPLSDGACPMVKA